MSDKPQPYQEALDKSALALGRIVQLLGTVGYLEAVHHFGVDDPRRQVWRVKSTVSDEESAKFLLEFAIEQGWRGTVKAGGFGMWAVTVESQ